MFDRLLHKFNEKFVKIWEKYGTIVCHRLAVNEGKLIFLISIFLVREHQTIQDGGHQSIRPRCFGNDKLVAVKL